MARLKSAFGLTQLPYPAVIGRDQSRIRSISLQDLRSTCSTASVNIEVRTELLSSKHEIQDGFCASPLLSSAACRASSESRSRRALRFRTSMLSFASLPTFEAASLQELGITRLNELSHWSPTLPDVNPRLVARPRTAL